MVLHRPVELALFIRTWEIRMERDRKCEAARKQWKNRGQQIVENYLTPSRERCSVCGGLGLLVPAREQSPCGSLLPFQS